jgi:PIN domain nuclease of toxin-antitoxin system
MIAGVADTHTALWYLYDDARLSVAAGDFIDQAGRLDTRLPSPPSAWRKSLT